MAAVTTVASAAAARIGAALSDAQYFESSMVRVEDIRRQLDSRLVKEKLDAMKRVIALISLGKDASTFFPDVVKNVVAQSIELKKLVYLYLVHYAEEKQDLALLAINSFQKDLSDHNQHIRALSLRVLSSIRVKVILQVVILAINKASKDSSSCVRKAAAYAIGKVCALDPSSMEMLMQPLQDLVSDQSTQVTGSAIAAFDEVCPNEWSLIHPHYRRMCSNLISVDPWGQITILTMLLRYARVHFTNPYSTNEANQSGEKSRRVLTKPRHPDLTLLLDSVAPTFYSTNNSVVACAIAIYYHLASDEEFCSYAIKPIMRLVGIPDDGGQAVGLNIAASVAIRHPSALIPYISEFYVSAAHSAPISHLRMKVISLICASAGSEDGLGSKPHARRKLLLELKEYLSRADKTLAASAARAIGLLATAHPGSTPTIVKMLSSVVSTSTNPAVVTESIGVLRRLLQRHPSAQAKALPQLIAMLLADTDSKTDPITEPAARASVVWLIGEFYDKVHVVAMEALRLLARDFAGEAPEVKLQILNLAAKLVARNEVDKQSPSNSHIVASPVLEKLLEFVITCAQYDKDYDVRDKARMFSHLLGPESRGDLRKRACEAFLTQKPTPVPESGSSAVDIKDDCIDPEIVIGSMSQVMGGRRLPGFTRLEPWALDDSDSSLRNEVFGDGEGAAVNREYRGVSSADFGITARSTSNNLIWEPPLGISSEMNGNATGASSGFIANMSGSASNARSIGNIDPDKFYASDDGDGSDSSEDEDESSEDSDESDGDNQNLNVNTGNMHSNLLINTMDLAPDSKQQPTTETTKSHSEYDLDALLNSLPETSANEDQNTVGDTSSQRLQSLHIEGRVKTENQRILEAWDSNGLEVDVAYYRNGMNAERDVSPVLIRICNRSKSTKNEIRFASELNDNFVVKETIPCLDVDQSAEVTAYIKFKGKMTSIRFRIEESDGSLSRCELKPSAGIIIRPYPEISPGGFLEAEKALTGMFGNECKVSLSNPLDNDWMRLSNAIKDQILDTCFISHVKTSIGGNISNLSERFSIAFAGFLPGSLSSNHADQRPVLIRIVCHSNDNTATFSCSLWVGCDDVLYGANLMKLCKSALQRIDKPI